MILALTIAMVAAAVLTSGALLMTVINLSGYRRPSIAAPAPAAEDAPLISVCVPARDEQENIEACVGSVLGQDYPRVEVVVYDDDSSDATPDILASLASVDDRVRTAAHRPLPDGWVGKQHACFQAARAARGDWLLFTDADVRLAPSCVRRTLHFARESHAQLVSTFPKQITKTLAERLVVPLIHFILFSYLPMPRMRQTTDPAASAGCGQFLFVSRQAYDTVGGHEAWKDSMHDGIRMPRAVRAAGHHTDLFDGTDAASCRMYDGWSEVWRGFTKNAYEGLGSVGLLVFLTVVHLVAHVGPPVYLIGALAGWWPPDAWLPASIAVVVALVQRGLLAARFHQSPISVLLHPAGVAVMTAIQWRSYLLHRSGKRTWRGRTTGEERGGAESSEKAGQASRLSRD